MTAFQWRLFHNISRKTGTNVPDCADAPRLSPSNAAAINSRIRTGKRIVILPQFDWIVEVPSYATVPTSARNDGGADQEVKERAAMAGVGFLRGGPPDGASRGPGPHSAVRPRGPGLQTILVLHAQAA